MLSYIIYLILWLPLHIIYPTRVIGRKNIIKNGKMIFSANHQTLNDAVILFGHVRRRMRYMAKGPLFKNKFFGWFLKKMGAYPVHHGQNDIASIKKTLKFLKDEKAVCIFPEGARLTSDEKNQLQNGVAMFALKTKAPIVPAIFMKKTYAFRFNTLIVGEPIKLYKMEQFADAKTDKDTLSQASLIIRTAIYSLKNNYIEKRKRKVFVKFQEKITKLEIKKAKAYTFARNKKVVKFDYKVQCLANKRNTKMNAIK